MECDRPHFVEPFMVSKMELQRFALRTITMTRNVYHDARVLLANGRRVLAAFGRHSPPRRQAVPMGTGACCSVRCTACSVQHRALHAVRRRAYRAFECCGDTSQPRPPWKIPGQACGRLASTKTSSLPLGSRRAMHTVAALSTSAQRHRTTPRLRAPSFRSSRSTRAPDATA